MGVRRKFGAGIRFAVMAVCYFLAVRCDAKVQDAARIAVVSLEDGGVTAERAELICGEEQGDGQNQGQVLSLCFWSEREEMQFSCGETGRTVQATGLLTEGDPELVTRECGILAWQEKGCMMDAVTAQELFGTRQADGQLAWWGGEAYSVYGVFESLERTVVLRERSGTAAGASTDERYDHLSLRAAKGADVKAETEQFLMRCGLSGDIADFTFPGVVCGNLLLVLPVLLAVGLARDLSGGLREEKRQRPQCISPDGAPGYGTEKSRGKSQNENGSGVAEGQNERKVPGRIVCIALVTAAVTALFVMLRRYLQIPADMIPTRWSDFSFWPQWWAGQKANLLRLLGSAQGGMQLEALWSFEESLICSILAIGAGISFLNTEK